ncbi:MAG: nucleotidyltransferase family protein [Devosia sp.]
MSGDLEATFCQLADPERAAVPVAPDSIEAVLDLAETHRVLPIVLRKLGDQVPEPRLGTLRRQLTDWIGPMLHLRMVSAQVNALVARGVAAAVVKGPELADAAYPTRADRPFTDLDIVASPEAHAALADLLHGLGYRLYRKPVMDHTESNQEQKWIHPEIPALLVEVHGNLVHYAALRRRVSFGYAELKRSEAASPELARFCTVVVHATLGHKLHQLKMLVDVLQTYRRLGLHDVAMLPQLAAELGLALEVGLCLDLVAKLFEVPAAAELARDVDPVERPYRRLVSPGTVLAYPKSRMAAARHHLFRPCQYLVPRR